VKLSTEQVHKDWEAISEAIEKALPPTVSSKGELRMHNIYKAIMGGIAECWLLVNNEETWLLGVLYSAKDGLTEDTNLYIFALYGYKPISTSLWVLIFSKIKEKAIQLGYKRVIGYSSAKGVVQIAETLGFDVSYTFMFMEV